MIIKRKRWWFTEESPETIEVSPEIILKKDKKPSLALFRLLSYFIGSLYEHLSEAVDYSIYYNNTKAGFIGLQRHDSGKTLYVGLIKTYKKYQGNHIATSVLNKVIELAKESGFKKITLVTGDWTPAGVHIYEKLGFKIIKSTVVRDDPNDPEYRDEFEMKLDL